MTAASKPVPSQDLSTLPPAHPTSVAFFDETGAIASDRFFTVGLLRVEDHAALLKQVKALRKQHKFWDEFKWTGLTAANSKVYIALIELLLASPAKFSCFVADRHVADPVARFRSTFAAYEKLGIQLLVGSIRPYELVSVLADNYSAPDNRCFENTVRDECNRRLDRLAVVSVVQVDSAATEGLQLVDVLTGAVGFGFRAAAGNASHSSRKGRVARHLRDLCGVRDFNAGHPDPNFNVKLYEHANWLRREQMRVGQGKKRVRRAGRGRSPQSVSKD
ncbi:MAG: DUF3800 domain-containing protein [Nocardioides sp.]